MDLADTQETSDLYPEVVEAPRFSCALGGAYMSALAAYGTVPILHAGAGCGFSQVYGLARASGQNADSYSGPSTPCSCLVEDNVIFGGEDKLRDLIASTMKVVRGKLYAIITGCVPALIGDDVGAVVQEFKEKVPIIHVNAAGFKGSTYNGYEFFFDAVIDQLLTELPKKKRLVNLLGIVPTQHVHWKGQLQVIKSLLEKIGIEVNIIFTERNGLEALKRIPAAEMNLVFSPWVGVKTAQKLQEKFGIPYEVISYVPVGPKDSTTFLKQAGKLLDVSEALIREVVQEEEWSAYRASEYFGQILFIGLPNAYIGVVADTSTAIGLTRYGSNELGWLPEVVIIADDPPEEERDAITRLLTEGLESTVKPKVYFQVDSHKIKLLLERHTLQLLLASSMEKFLPRGDAMHLSVSFPIFDRVIVDRSYAGYRGGLALMEDVGSQYARPS
jgi:nitrogenase molybdenum-iron protein beta chain